MVGPLSRYPACSVQRSAFLSLLTTWTVCLFLRNCYHPRGGRFQSVFRQLSRLFAVCVCVLALQLIYLISEQSLWTNSWEICPLAPPPATHSFSLSAPPGRPSPGLIKEASLDWEQLGSCDLPRQAARRGFFFPVSGTVKLTRIARQRGQQIQYTERIGIRAGKKRGLKVCAREKSERGDTL